MKVLLRFAGVLGVVVGLQLFACIDVDGAVTGFCADKPEALGCSDGGADAGDGGTGEIPDGGYEPPGWKEGPDMDTPRAGHTATKLSDGSVLVVGGEQSAGQPVAGVELYLPKENRWKLTGSLKTARADHTATLLSGDRVLVVGGRGPNGLDLSSAEIFDPVSKTWSPAGTMPSGARASHAAALLPSGEVLVAGGGMGAMMGNSDLYSPGSGTWRSAGSLKDLRNTLTLTVVNGKAVAIGGFNSFGALATAEQYDPPPSGTGWSALPGQMAERRNGHAATPLLSGKVLVTGSRVGSNPAQVSAAVELLDMAGPSWSTQPSLKEARFGHTATELMSGQVLVTGGWKDDHQTPRASAELYLPGGGWTLIAPMSTARAFHTATRLDSGAVLIVGGVTSTGMVRSTERYVPER
ncbi:Kelch repeat-containing protein [Myxococcus stipitatus]|uniref:Kelch repeat-containing protein n=1 Tax=Myxococcus stipitatus TaxID=83455 RepID=UPI0030D219B1